jgi:hypothetical protein
MAQLSYLAEREQLVQAAQRLHQAGNERTIGGEKPFPAGALERERQHMQRFGSTS